MLIIHGIVVVEVISTVRLSTYTTTVRSIMKAATSVDCRKYANSEHFRCVESSKMGQLDLRRNRLTLNLNTVALRKASLIKQRYRL